MQTVVQIAKFNRVEATDIQGVHLSIYQKIVHTHTVEPNGESNVTSDSASHIDLLGEVSNKGAKYSKLVSFTDQTIGAKFKKAYENTTTIRGKVLRASDFGINLFGVPESMEFRAEVVLGLDFVLRTGPNKETRHFFETQSAEEMLTFEINEATLRTIFASGFVHD